MNQQSTTSSTGWSSSLSSIDSGGGANASSGSGNFGGTGWGSGGQQTGTGWGGNQLSAFGTQANPFSVRLVYCVCVLYKFLLFLFISDV